VSAIARRPAPGPEGGERIDLVCASGHRTSHSLARVVRLNDGWCGKCGAAISYAPLADAGLPAPVSVIPMRSPAKAAPPQG
jgi:hypothetical protein